MHAGDWCLAGWGDRSGELVAQVGVPLADVYLEFLGGRCRPNTVLAAAYDLKVFFTVVALRASRRPGKRASCLPLWSATSPPRRRPRWQRPGT